MKILFQGDSITDCGRNYGADYSYGEGYAMMVAGRLGLDELHKYEFINKGVSGNRVTTMFARWKEDTINHMPDIISILIGVNDVWHDLDRNVGVDADLFEKVYDLLLAYTLKELPHVKIVLMEPFILHGPATNNNWERFTNEVAKRRAVIYRLSEKYKLPVIELDKVFKELCKTTPEDIWTIDGVHPSVIGHQVIADKWIEWFKDSDCLGTDMLNPSL